jgi:predicted transcriptional regulator
MPDATLEDHLEIVAHIVGAYVTKNPVPSAELPALISSVANAIAGLRGSATQPQVQAKQKPAVAISKSITPDYLISLEDGQQFKSLKRALAVRYGLTPDQYRAKWGLPHDYPMVAPN